MVDPRQLAERLGAAWQVQTHGEIDSTQTAMRTWLLQDTAADWRLLTAKHQTAGRGRSGAQWLDHPGQALLMTLAGPVALAAELWPRLSLLAGLAALEYLSAHASMQGVRLQLKWPNDLMVPTDRGLRKCAGILTERVEVPGHGARWLCGIGVDLGGPLPAELSGIAVPLQQVAKGPLPEPSALAAGLAEAIRSEVQSFDGALPHERLQRRLAYLRQMVELDMGPLQQARLFRLAGLAADGQLQGSWQDRPTEPVTVQPLALRPLA
ncbi:MAG: hypothetical protein HY902_00910 [Deltaproteobacteria bacterium]|nr:hypothetical protein [Deltaproteobacteria bacterium]